MHTLRICMYMHVCFRVVISNVRILDIAVPPKHVIKKAIMKSEKRKKMSEKCGGPPPAPVYLADHSGEIGMVVYSTNPAKAVKVW